ncbi:sensor histidine kinase [Pseudoduganella sp. RAF53_2]|uniref:sensor histidine kinase n=1 Tax=unclassified Pseudoduganella TaxID=2637179 RepID=UPI003F9E6BFB
MDNDKDTSDAAMVRWMRLVLAIACLLTLVVDPAVVGRRNTVSLLVFVAYALQSATLLILASRAVLVHSKIVSWLDVGWFTLMTYFTGGDSSFFYLLFFFAVLTASFSHGHEEGARITLVASVVVAVSSVAAQSDVDLARVMLRATFLLALGYMIAHWGGMAMEQRQRMGLMHAVSQLSNPRFGVDRTIASVMDHTREFYKADSCILLMCDNDADGWSLRTASAESADRPLHASHLSAEAALPLLVGEADDILLLRQRRRPWLRHMPQLIAYSAPGTRWIERDPMPGQTLAELLDACSLIAVPVPLRRGSGRLYVVSERRQFSKADALFMHQIAAQAFPVIENIELLDRMASEAVLRERERIARDLHDTTIQPYIGLRHGVSAIRKKAEPGNPLNEDLDSLVDMTQQVIRDLRNYAKSLRGGLEMKEPELLIALRRQAAQVRQFYDVHIAVDTKGELNMSDRLAAEVFQIVNEGMSNICKHTTARHGYIELACDAGKLSVHIENECNGHPVLDFTPSSIAERAAALGGVARVQRGRHNNTAVQIIIPV